MITCSNEVRKMMSGAEPYSICLQILMNSLCQYKQALAKKDRSLDEFQGNERRFASNLQTLLQNSLGKSKELQDYDVECEFNKHGNDYAQLCGCHIPDVISRFVEIMKGNPEDEDENEKQYTDNVYPDIIFHSPGNMEGQACIVEIKVKNANKNSKNNTPIYNDLKKLTKFKEACTYLSNYIKQGNPVFRFHVFMLLGQSLTTMIKNEKSEVLRELRNYHPDIICIYQEGDDFQCKTLGEILGEVE